MTLPPITKDVYDLFQFEWSEPGMGIGSSVGASGSGYMIGSYDNLPCQPYGQSGVYFKQAPIEDMWQAIPKVTEDSRLDSPPWTYMQVSLGIYQYFSHPGAVQYVAPCQSTPIVIQTYPVELDMAIHEGSPDGPIAVDYEGVERRLIMSGGQYVQVDGDTNMGWRSRDMPPWPQYYWKVDSGFFHNMYIGLYITARVSIAAPPVPPPPIIPPPPPTEPAPSPPCRNLQTPSTVAVGDQMSGMVPITP